MAEIRLICPGCSAEYRVPDTAIPSEGREVECSACGNVWHAKAQPARLTLADAMSRAAAIGAEPPPLSRRLPDAVLDILRDEVEHERRARAAEGEAPAQPPVPAAQPLQPTPPRAVDPEWPATTVTTAITRHIDPKPPEAPVSQPEPEPALPVAAPVQAAPAGRAKPLLRAETSATTAARAAPPAPVLVLAPRPRQGGSYAAGFGLAAMLAAGGVTLYLLAPALADQGAFGQEVTELREQVDQARLWLQDRVASLAR